MNFRTPEDAERARQRAEAYRERWRNPAAMLGMEFPRTMSSWLRGSSDPAEVFLGALPPDLPLDLPLPEAATLVGSATRPAGAPPADAPTGNVYAVILETTQLREEIAAFYTRELTARGWYDGDDERAARRWAATPPEHRYWTFCAGPHGPSLKLSFMEVEQALPLRVLIEIDAASRGPCTDLPDLGDLEPDDYADADRPSVFHLGGDGSDSGWTKYEVVPWSGSGAELERHLAAQLEGIGWSTLARGESGGLTWSHWAFKGSRGGGWEATLQVAHERGRPDCYVYMRSARPEQRYLERRR